VTIARERGKLPAGDARARGIWSWNVRNVMEMDVQDVIVMERCRLNVTTVMDRVWQSVMIVKAKA